MVLPDILRPLLWYHTLCFEVFKFLYCVFQFCLVGIIHNYESDTFAIFNRKEFFIIYSFGFPMICNGIWFLFNNLFALYLWASWCLDKAQTGYKFYPIHIQPMWQSCKGYFKSFLSVCQSCFFVCATPLKPLHWIIISKTL